MAETQASEDARLRETVQRLLDVPTVDLKVALSHATDAVASALRADKVDAFLYDASRDALSAVGTSSQPLSALQRKLWLDVLPMSNGGRAVFVYQGGTTFVSGRADQDPEELRGIKEALKIRSELGVPLDVDGTRRGVLLISSLRPDFFTQGDVRFAEIVTRWVGVVAHRAELVEAIARTAIEEGRRAVAEELITVLAHDLRNYLSPIRTRLQLLGRRAERDRRASDLRDLDLATRALDRLGGIISDVLDVARIDRGVFRMDVQPVDRVGLLEQTATALSTPDCPITVKVSEEVIVSADPERIRQCVENLLSNAVKHSPRGASVTILVARQRQEEGESARVEVVDEGPGIAPEMLTHIFERFVTGQVRQGGLGLGLYLAKRIAVIHGGDLTVESHPGSGSRFILMLPCCQEPSESF